MCTRFYPAELIACSSGGPRSKAFSNKSFSTDAALIGVRRKRSASQWSSLDARKKMAGHGAGNRESRLDKGRVGAKFSWQGEAPSDAGAGAPPDLSRRPTLPPYASHRRRIIRAFTPSDPHQPAMERIYSRLRWADSFGFPMPGRTSCSTTPQPS